MTLRQRIQDAIRGQMRDDDRDDLDFIGGIASAILRELGISDHQADDDTATVAVETQDMMQSTWCIEDVFCHARDNNKVIGLEEARNVLSMLKRKHDATIGINWDVIDFWIDEIASGQPDTYLPSDQPQECPNCGARTEFTEDENGRQMHDCNQCFYYFVVEDSDE